MATPNPIDYEAIRNSIARYSLALDTKNFDLFSEVFTQNVEAKYPFGPNGGVIKGQKELGLAIKTRLEPVTTQHAITTQSLEIDETGKAATAVTYFTGIHFGTGRCAGRKVTSCGKYCDTVVLIPDTQGIPGSSGQWLVSKRELVFMGRWGDEDVMKGE